MSLLTTALEQFNNTSFPDRSLTNPASKTPQWTAQMAKAGVTEFLRNEGAFRFFAHDDTVGENILYAEGEQDTQQYRRYKGGASMPDARSLEISNRDGHFNEATGRVEYSHGGAGPQDPMGLESIIQAKPLPILPVKLRGLKSTITQADYEATITALGRKAEQEFREHEAEVRLWMDLGPQMRELGQHPPEGMPDPMPQTEPELRTYLDNYQIAAAAELERKVKICGTESALEQQMSEVADDLLRHGYACMHDFQSPGKRPISKRIAVHRGLFPPSAYPDYRDLSMGGHLETIHLDQLLSEASQNSNNYRATVNGDGKNWNKDDIARLRQAAARSLPDTMQNGQLLGDPVNTGALTVVRWYFLTQDTLAQENYRDETGRPRTKKAKADQSSPSQAGGKVTQATVGALYEATLVCDTNLCYNCRKVYDQGRDLHDPSKARMPYSIFVGGAAAGRPVSIVTNAKGIVNEIERSWRGYMADMRTYMPEGFNVSPQALDAMAGAIKGLSPDAGPMEAYKFIKQTGDSFLPNFSTDNPLQPITPITKNPGGIPASATVHLANLQQQLQLLEAVTGANAVVSAVTPNSEAGKGVNQIALQGAANVMAFLRDGLLRLYKNHVRNLAGRIWLTEKDVPVTGSVAGRGGQSEQVGPRPDLHEYGFFMEVEFGPTAEQVQELRSTAFQATQGGPAAQLNYDDYLHVCWLLDGNLKTAQRYMAMAVTRKRRQDQAAAADLQKQNGDVQTQTAQAAAQAQQQTDAAKFELDMKRLQFERETIWGNPTPMRQLEVQQAIARGNQQAKIEVAHISETGDAARTDAKHEHAADLAAAQQRHEQNNTVLAAALAPPAPTPA